MTIAQDAPTRQQAQEQLATTDLCRLSSPVRDRRLNAVSIVVMGVCAGVLGVCAAEPFATGTLVAEVALAALISILLVVLFWQRGWVEQTAETVPHRARLTAALGFFAYFCVGNVVVQPWLLEEADGPTWALVGAGAAVAFTPAVLAAAVIGGRGTLGRGRVRAGRWDGALALPVRLRLVAALTEVDAAELGRVREAIGITDPTLSRQTAVQLEHVGYVKIRKVAGKRPRTWLSLTHTGRAACTRHLAALGDIADGA
ncbi:MAG: transcriptional regulator [Mycobacteriaceae bacterium]